MAMESLFMILVVLAVLLTVGVPISYSIGISALRYHRLGSGYRVPW